MPATYFEFRLIGVELPKTEKERKRNCLLQDSNPGSVRYPTGYQILVPEQQHQRVVGWAQKILSWGRWSLYQVSTKTELTTASDFPSLLCFRSIRSLSISVALATVDLGPVSRAWEQWVE
jgi:hypothetical protein